jgi:hypothetical protein
MRRVSVTDGTAATQPASQTVEYGARIYVVATTNMDWGKTGRRKTGLGASCFAAALDKASDDPDEEAVARFESGPRHSTTCIAPQPQPLLAIHPLIHSAGRSHLAFSTL